VASLLYVSLSKPMIVFAEMDLYPFPSVDDLKVKSPTEKKQKDPFVLVLAKKFAVEEHVLSQAVDKGFGRTELIRLILIAQKSGKNLDDVLKERENGARLAKIAQNHNQDNAKIRKEALALLKELEEEEKKVAADLNRSSATVAGVSVSTMGASGSQIQKPPESGKN